MTNKISQSDIIAYAFKAFDADKYFKLQKSQILNRLNKSKSEKLYLEIGGKFLFDAHASRVLPGFDPEVKKKIFLSLKDKIDIFFCVNYKNIIENRQLSNINEDYSQSSINLIKQIKDELGLKVKVIINLTEDKNHPKLKELTKELMLNNYEIFYRFQIKDYPHNTNLVLSDNGYGKDDYIQSNKNLILVTGSASNSGKMSTCLGQIYLDKQNNINSTYAKYETFPIWNLALNHPVNLAYEAATADIGDYNQIDPYHKKVYGLDSVNYNRDIEAFEIITKMLKSVVDKDNLLNTYKSPTDMGISNAGFAITNEKLVIQASIEEIRRRKKWYQEIIDRGEGDLSWVDKCNKLEEKANMWL